MNVSTSCGCGSTGECLVFTCAGAAYSGQVANRAGVQLHEQGAGNLFCIAAVAADIGEKVARTRAAGQRIAIDGCEEHCVRKTLERAGLTAEVHVVVTDLGIEKKPAQPSMISDARRVVDAVAQRRAAVTGVRCCGG
jgi:uncharacterized metal-binding protein